MTKVTIIFMLQLDMQFGAKESNATLFLKLRNLLFGDELFSNHFWRVFLGSQVLVSLGTGNDRIML